MRYINRGQLSRSKGSSFGKVRRNQEGIRCKGSDDSAATAAPLRPNVRFYEDKTLQEGQHSQ